MGIAILLWADKGDVDGFEEGVCGNYFMYLITNNHTQT